MKKTILITGSEGQLGKEIQKISEQNPFSAYNFIFTDIISSGTNNKILDITDQNAVNKLFASEKIDYVINCAAYTAVDKAEEEKEKAFLINATAPAILAECSSIYNAKIIHFSTDYVYDGTNSIPYKETDSVNPQSAYGKTKLSGEKAVIQVCSDSIIIRTSWLYSAFGNNFIKTILKYGKERGALNVVFDQIGTPTYAKDLAVAVLKIIDETENDNNKFIPGIYHFSNEGVCSWYDFAQTIIKLSGISCNIIPVETKDYPLPAKRPAYSVLNKEKIKKTFNIEIPYWQDGVEDCLKNIIK
ncbi:MAG: dTDP-4-dehydrorhamnose reductase [Bacteroidetes bacterium RIFOXYA12_FULL_35_11]|nr:MAG: dTDP-4-dehydrorhamnose reductase [Bacteroidetes bacterium GWF2_35_48]OFY75609.1 MAG: dTDP-4-dehydrorhamnose reductase [Bacteroidetes bacterium RIFOXYA12_FULL_35_11]OFY95383.1 MAG: dTDP-4-dehydrorhamnose reductase [Bacteroidetes bacterium RIFOXYC12_FULL_35_7]HBX52068.1 dTDP-4-dehydrorhamnose reductase [Bacteroidales bacterium]